MRESPHYAEERLNICKEAMYYAGKHAVIARVGMVLQGEECAKLRAKLLSPMRLMRRLKCVHVARWLCREWLLISKRSVALEVLTDTSLGD